MFKRLVLIGALCVGLVAVWGGAASAYPPSLSGWSFKVGSVDASTLWTGVGNYELKPTDIVITLSDIQLRLYSINPGGNTGGVGVPFNLSAPVQGTDSISPISKNGKYASLIVFPDSAFTALIDPVALEQALPNPNWTLDPNHVDVVHFKALIQGFTDVTDRCENYYINNTVVDTSCYPFTATAQTRYEEEVVHVLVDCNLQNGAYVCSTLQDWGYSKQNPVFVP